MNRQKLILTEILDYLKIHRSTVISQKIGQGQQLEHINMTDIDSEFSTKLLASSFKKIQKLLPKSDKLKENKKIRIKLDSHINIKYQIPDKNYNHFLEGYPSKISIFNFF